MNNEACEDCRAHGRLDQRVAHVEQSDSRQWQEINGMKKFVMGTLAVAVLNLFGVIIILLIHLARASGAGEVFIP